MFGFSMAPKEILSCLLNPCNLKILDLYQETWLWLPLIYVKKALHRDMDIWDNVRTFFNCVFFQHSYLLVYFGHYFIVTIIFINFAVIIFNSLLLLPLIIITSFIIIMFDIIISYPNYHLLYSLLPVLLFIAFKL